MSKEARLLRSIMWAVAGSLAAYLAASMAVPAGWVAVIVEELAKASVLWGGKRVGAGVGWKQGMVVGLFFGLTELILYAPQLWEMGAGSVWGQRAIYTVPMHALTTAIIGGQPWGIIVSILLHGIFNLVVG